MKKIRIVLIVALLVACVGALGATGKDEGPATLRFSWWGGESRHKATLASIAAFQAKNPNVKIEAEYMGWEGYFDKLVTQVAGGSAADIIQSDYKFFPQLVAQGGVYMDLGKVKGLIDTSGFEPEFLKKWCIYDGKLLGLPTGLNSQTAIINTTLMNKEGIAWQRSWTWDMILEEGKKLHAKNPAYYFLVQGPENLVYQVLMPYLMQLTGTNLIQDAYTISFTKDDLAKGLGYIKTLLDAGRAAAAGPERDVRGQHPREPEVGERAGRDVPELHHPRRDGQGRREGPGHHDPAPADDERGEAERHPRHPGAAHLPR